MQLKMKNGGMLMWNDDAILSLQILPSAEGHPGLLRLTLKLESGDGFLKESYYLAYIEDGEIERLLGAV